MNIEKKHSNNINVLLHYVDIRRKFTTFIINEVD